MEYGLETMLPICQEFKIICLEASSHSQGVKIGSLVSGEQKTLSRLQKKIHLKEILKSLSCSQKKLHLTFFSRTNHF